MADARVLVVGASGQLGGTIARRLLAGGTPVRALGRSVEKLAPLAEAGAEVVGVDLLNQKNLADACRDVDQIVATANNAMGSGATSPSRVDLTGYQNLCAAARNARVQRLIYVSYRGVDQDSPVDFLRVKWYVGDAIRRSGVPYVLLSPTHFMETWIRDLMVPEIRKRGGAMIFGDGTAVANYIAIDDVAEFAVRILASPDVVNEKIDVGGPSNISMNDLATLVERHLNATGRRRKTPAWMLKALTLILRPFNEVTARQIAFGLHLATEATPFADWQTSAARFGVTPRSVEDFVADLPA